jgi:hypothetical protein
LMNQMFPHFKAGSNGSGVDRCRSESTFYVHT